MLQPGWYRTTGGDLVCLQQWPSGSGGQVNWGRVVNVGSFYYDEQGRVLGGDEQRPELDLDGTSWRPFPVGEGGSVCVMHRYYRCLACAEGEVPVVPGRIQTGDIVRQKQGAPSLRMRVTAMSLDGQGGSFEVIKKDGTADRRYERWSGGFGGYELVEKGFPLQGRGTQENIRVANEQEEKEKL